MSIPLRRLDLHGYKSFARNTQFLFDRGITVIVGPNGSGKSNVADALRWVLGEQSYSTLRGRRTEDMIFSGSDGHRRMGMAQASLTFDNDGGWLPVDFSEVTISRHAYRSGENEYLLNGSRVRLRDITELLVEAGLSQRTYTVIGQGLVDRALALNPQERRVLFEEAAGIVGYQAQRAEALGKLDETEGNLIRVRDIIAEIAPGLARLARQAQEAERQAELSSQLEDALHIWYGYQWQTGLDRLSLARAHAQRQAALLCGAQAQLQATQQEMARLHDETLQLRAQCSAMEEERQALERSMAELDRERAVREERQRLLLQRQAEAAEQQSGLQREEASKALRVSQVESALAQLVARGQEQQAEIERLQAQAGDLDRERSDLQACIHTLRERAGELSQAQAARHAEWSQLRRRHNMLLEARVAAQEVMRREQEKASALDEERRAITKNREELAAQLSELEEELQNLRGQREALRGHRDELEAIGEKLEGEMARLLQRQELLSQIRGQTYSPGVQTVLKAAQEEELIGIRGPVAQLLRVPPHLEEAIQAALDNRLQDLVVEDWAAAQRAVTFLIGSGGGRASFVPLEALRVPPLMSVPQVEGVIGRASDLVSVAEGLRELAVSLLGHTLIVQDLNLACGLLPSLEEGSQVVTLKGEVVRADGSLTVGSESQTRSEALARETEWRELPVTVSELVRRREDLGHQKTALGARLESSQRRAAEVEAEVHCLRTALDELTTRAESLAQLLNWSIRALEWQRERRASDEEESTWLAEQESGARESLFRLEVEAAEVRAKLAELEERDRSLKAEELTQELEKARTASAVRHEALRRERERLEEYRLQRRQMIRQLKHLAGRVREERERLATSDSELQQLTEQEAENRRRLVHLAEQEKPIEARLDSIGLRQKLLASAEHDLQQRIREYQGRADHSSLAVDRCQDELDRLQERILQDLGLTQLEVAEQGDRSYELATQPPLPLEPFVTALPKVAQLPEGVEEHIRLLRSQLRRLQRVNPEAPTEYAELKGRHEFLMSQLSDLEAAAHSLRQIVAELDRVMESRFCQTFEAASGQFAEYFSLLFDGGHAELVLTEPQDPSQTGVDIRVRPSGKREQELALLSGGERALIALALIFATLSISATPFCLLDEVDAALDEANSGRFRCLLERLAMRTQFIVITHNRQTIEAANSIYGLSMDEHGVSQVISLRLDEVAAMVGA